MRIREIVKSLNVFFFWNISSFIVIFTDSVGSAVPVLSSYRIDKTFGFVFFYCVFYCCFYVNSNSCYLHELNIRTKYCSISRIFIKRPRKKKTKTTTTITTAKKHNTETKMKTQPKKQWIVVARSRQMTRTRNEQKLSCLVRTGIKMDNKTSRNCQFWGGTVTFWRKQKVTTTIEIKWNGDSVSQQLRIQTTLVRSFVVFLPFENRNRNQNLKPVNSCTKNSTTNYLSIPKTISWRWAASAIFLKIKINTKIVNKWI